MNNPKTILTSKIAWTFALLLVLACLQMLGIVDFELETSEAEGIIALGIVVIIGIALGIVAIIGIALGIVAIIGIALRIATDKRVHFEPME